MKKQFRAVSALLMCIALLAAFVPAVHAETVVDSGSADGFSWRLTEDGTLTVTGKGAMPDRFLWTPDNTSYPHRQEVKRLVLSEGITAISEGAFSVYNIESVSLPSTLVSIGNYAFSDCQALQSLVMPDQIREIGDNVFQNCGRLTQITLPAGLETFGISVFYYCPSLSGISISADNPYFCCEDGVLYNKAKTELLAFPSAKAQADLPAGLRSISQSAFQYNRALTSIRLPDSLETIGDRAFEGSESLQAVTGGAGLKRIGNYAFGDCRKLQTFSFGPSLYEIEEGAFRSCALRSVVLPDGFSSLGIGAFSGCAALESLHLSASLKIIPASAFMYCEKLQTVQLPAGLIAIGVEAFYGCDLSEIQLPEALLYIGDSAFIGNKRLGEIYIPASVEFIGQEAFQSLIVYAYDRAGTNERVSICNVSFRVSQDNAFYASDAQGILYNKEKTELIFCPLGLSTVVVPAGVKKIKSRAFMYRSCLSVNLPDTLETIEEEAFYRSSVSTVNMPDVLKTVGKNAFFGTSVNSLKLPNSLREIEDGAFRFCSNLKEITFGSGLKIIGGSAFQGCSEKLNSIALPDGLLSIGGLAFGGALGLKSVKLPSSLVSVSTSSFEDTPWLRSYTGHTPAVFGGIVSRNGVLRIPDGTKVIAAGAFRDRADITEVVVPDSVAAIGEGAFQNCGNLVKIGLPAGITEIADSVFEGCTSLRSILLPVGIRSIGDGAFMNCAALHAVTLPGNVVSVGANAFSGCTALTALSFGDGITHVGGSAFQGVPWLETQPDGVVYIGKCAYSYSGNMPENTTVTFREGTTAVCNYIFSNFPSQYDGLVGVELPESLKEIGDFAFGYCSNLRKVNLPNGLQKIGNNAFDGCKLCDTIVIPDTVTELGVSAFQSTGVKHVTVGSGVTVLPEFLFFDSDLQTVFVPGSVTRIKINCFRDIPLTTVYYGGPEAKWVTVGIAGFNDALYDARIVGTDFVLALGDVNGDGDIGADDARLALRCSVDLENYLAGSPEFTACDINKDGSVGADDARRILRASVDLEALPA